MFNFFALLVIFGTTSAIDLGHGPLLSHGSLLSHGPLIHSAPALITKPIIKTVEVEAPAHYDFSYSVKDEHTGDIKSQTESRKGDVVHGQYSLVDADGYLRTVDYTSDAHNGFNAVVRRDPLGHKVVKAVAPVAKILAPIGHIAAPRLLAAPIHSAPALGHVSVQSTGYAYSH